MGFDKNSDCQRTLQTFQPNGINRVNEPDRCFQETHSVLWSSDGGRQRLSWNRLVQPRDLLFPWSSSSLEQSIDDLFPTLACVFSSSIPMNTRSTPENKTLWSHPQVHRYRKGRKYPHIWQKSGWATWGDPQAQCALGYSRDFLASCSWKQAVVIATPWLKMSDCPASFRAPAQHSELLQGS